MRKLLPFILFLVLFFLTFSETSFAQPQMNIQGSIYSIDTLNHYKVGPGSYYTALELTGKNKLHVYFLEVDAANPYIRFNSLIGCDSIISCERISKMATRHSKEGELYFAGTNADFFQTTGEVGKSIGGSITSGEIGMMPHSSREMIGFNSDNTPFLDVMAFQGTLNYQNTNFTFSGVNKTRSSNQLILYNSLNGKYTHTDATGTEILIAPLNGIWKINEPITVKVAAVYPNKGNSQIPAGMAILSGVGTAKTFLDKIQKDDELLVTVNYKQIHSVAQGSPYAGVSGRYYIIQKGVVSTENWNELHPRTALGYTQDGKKVIFLVVDGRGVSAGVTTMQLADIIKSAGAYEALNLDGGGSSGMYIKEFGMMNRCSDGAERAVANGIFAVSTAPSDLKIAEIIADKTTYRVPYCGIVKPTFYGYNQYGVLIDADVQGVQLSCTPEMGYINSDHAFVASGTTGGDLCASYGDIKAKIKIQFNEVSNFSLLRDSVIADNRKPYLIEVCTTVEGKNMQMLPEALSWRIKDPDICKIDAAGHLIGLKNGQTAVYGQMKGQEDTLFVNVQNPSSSVMPLSYFKEFTTDQYSYSSNISNLQFTPNQTDGASIQFTYNSGRSPFIRLSNPMTYFGLPDSLQFSFNPGNLAVDKLVVSLCDAQSTVATSFVNTPIATNKETVYTIPVSSLMDINNRALYPIHLGDITFYLKSNTAGQNYSLNIHHFAAVYDQVVLGMFSPQIASRIHVYPNPTEQQELYISFDKEYAQQVNLSLYTLQGRLIKQATSASNTLLVLPLQDVQKGNYLLQVSVGEHQETTKIMVR